MKKKSDGLARGKMADEKFMKIALKLSQQGLGYTEPNPMVGAVVVKNGKILFKYYHLWDIHFSFNSNCLFKLFLFPVLCSKGYLF